MAQQSREAEERADEMKYFRFCIEEMEDDIECGILAKEMPRLSIVKYHDLLGKLWGWDKLLPMGDYVSWSDYSNYLEEYHCRNVDATSSIAALAQTCLKSEKQLMSQWSNQMKPEKLLTRKSIVLSCLIHERVGSFGCTSSDVSRAALLCIGKEADLTCELLRCGADPVDDYLINQGREIRTCALSLMNCTLDNSVATSALLLGMAKEAEVMCVWMSENNKPVDFSDLIIPDEIVDSRMVRYKTLNVMIKILEESAAAAWRKIEKEGPSSYMGADLAISCFKMEDELLSEWNTRAIRSINDTLPVSTIIQSSLIKELALSICSTGAQLSYPTDMALLCITKEADLMCELLKLGAEPFDDIILQSSVIRMCAYGLANLKGRKSIPAAAAVMVGVAYEAKKMLDWIKRENKLVISSFSEPHDLEDCRKNRMKALGVMTGLLHDSSLSRG